MISHIYNGAELLKQINNKLIKNIWAMYSYSFDSITREKGLDLNDPLRVYLELEDYAIEIYNESIENDILEDYIKFSIRIVSKSELYIENEFSKVLSLGVSGNITNLEIINDRFERLDFDEVVDVDIAIQMTIDEDVYYIIGWDMLPGDMSFISKEEFNNTVNNPYRERLNTFWNAKSPNIKTFKRTFIKLEDR